MKKGILTSLICFTSMVLFSCGSKTVKVTILECTHCSFEDVGKADVRQDLIVQSYPDRGYELDDQTNSLEIYAGGIHFDRMWYTFNSTNNKLTIKKDILKFGDISIKGNAEVRQNNLKYVLNTKDKYDQEETLLQGTIVTIEDYDYTQKITCGGNPIAYEDIKVYPSDVIYTYNESTLKITKENCYTDITITLP